MCHYRSHDPALQTDFIVRKKSDIRYNNMLIQRDWLWRSYRQSPTSFLITASCSALDHWYNDYSRNGTTEFAWTRAFLQLFARSDDVWQHFVRFHFASRRETSFIIWRLLEKEGRWISIYVHINNIIINIQL